MLTTEQLTAIYEREMENQPSAGLDVTTANENIRDALAGRLSRRTDL